MWIEGVTDDEAGKYTTIDVAGNLSWEWRPDEQFDGLGSAVTVSGTPGRTRITQPTSGNYVVDFEDVISPLTLGVDDIIDVNAGFDMGLGQAFEGDTNGVHELALPANSPSAGRQTYATIKFNRIDGAHNIAVNDPNVNDTYGNRGDKFLIDPANTEVGTFRVSLAIENASVDVIGVNQIV